MERKEEDELSGGGGWDGFEYDLFEFKERMEKGKEEGTKMKGDFLFIPSFYVVHNRT
jgi:hypothetical protein